MKPSVPVPEVIAHRGNSFIAPENKLAALALGWQETTTCEVDIHSTLDGRLLVIHDASTLRTTGTDLIVARRSLSELERLEAGSWKGPSWAGEKLPTLEQVIAAMPAGKRLLIEIKAGPEIVPELSRVIGARGNAKQLALQSFDLPTCAECRRAMADIPVAYLIAFSHEPEAWPPVLDEALHHARNVGLNGINVNDAPFLDDVVPRIHAADLSVFIWTVDELAEAKRLVALGVDGIITNRPGWLKAQLAI